MKSYTTKGTVLARTDYGEADRIITFLTDDHGKVKVMARGIRKAKAKLAGSVELFSVSDLTVLPGKSELDTLMSARLVKHFGNIVKNLERTNLAFEFLKLTDKATEELPEPGYFECLSLALAGLDNSKLDPGLIELWFNLHLLKLGGHSPNLDTDEHGRRLAESKHYTFHDVQMNFSASPRGRFTVDHIKLLRLAMAARKPDLLGKVKGASSLSEALGPLSRAMLQAYVRI